MRFILSGFWQVAANEYLPTFENEHSLALYRPSGFCIAGVYVRGGRVWQVLLIVCNCAVGFYNEPG